jgi:hypothetical protein
LTALLWSELEIPHRAFRRSAEVEDHRDLLWRRALWTSLVASNDTSAGSITRARGQSGPSLLQAHHPSAIALRGGYRTRGGSVLTVGARWVLHDAVDPQFGYPAVSTIEVARVELGMNSSRTIAIDEATVVRIENLVSASGKSRVVWKIDIGARRLPHDGQSSLHLGTEVDVGMGIASLHPSSSVALYSMIGARPGTGLNKGEAKFLPMGIWSAGFLLRAASDFRIRVSTEYSLPLNSLGGGEMAMNVVARKGLMRDLDLELAGTLGVDRTGATVGFVSFH